MNSQYNLEKENKVGGLTYPDFKTYWKATAIMRIQNKENYIDQQKELSLKTNLYICQLTFNEDIKTTVKGESYFQQTRAGTTGQSHKE